MATHPQPIDLAGAIADLTPIDWASLEAEAPGPVDRAVIGRLKLLDRIVRACADISSTRGETLSGRRASVDDAAPATWGPFTIHERVGHGTFGDVYRAHDRRLDRVVALKLLRPGQDDGDVVESEAIHEGRLLAKVRHPNVVTVYGAERIDGRVGMWMEFIGGCTLEEELKANGPLPVKEIIAIGLTLCDALAAVHEAGLLHRDLKASNVLRASDGRILLTDFGAGHVIAAHDDEGPPELAGTPLYLAPEVLAGKPASIASEIYGFGVLLYHLATGAFPVRGRTLRELREAHATGERVSIRAYRDTLSRALMAVIERAIDPDPAKRFTSVERLRAALRRADRRAISWPLVAACAAACVLAVVALVRMRQPALAVVAQHVVARNSGSGDTEIVFVRGNRVYFIEKGLMYSTGLDPADKPEPVFREWNGFHVLDIDRTASEYLALGTPEPNGDRQLWVASKVSGHPRRIGSVKCVAATWSPDNSQIACLATGNALSIANSDGSNVRSLRGPPGVTISGPHWSPDGTRLRFNAATYDRDVVGRAIWEIRADGSDLHETLPGWNAPLGSCCGSWTPDGAYYVFRAQSRETGLMEIWAVREHRTWFDWSRPVPIRLAGGPLTYDSAIFTSGDSNTIVAMASRLQGELVRLDMRSRQFKPYLDGVAGTWIAFSPDQQTFSYISYPIKRLWQMGRTGRRQLIDAPVEADGVMWSPDGQWLSFVSRLAGMHRRVFLAKADGSNAQPIITTDDEQGIASWSPDSRRIVYGDVPIRFGVGAGTERLHIYDLERQTITDVPGSNGLWTSRYSPDGPYDLAALTIDPQNMTLMLRHRNTGTWRALPEANHINNFTWSHDAGFIFYHYYNTEDGTRGIRRVRISDGHVEDLANLQDFYVFQEWSGLAPDDSPLVLRNMRTIDIYALTLKRRWP